MVAGVPHPGNHLLPVHGPVNVLEIVPLHLELLHAGPELVSVQLLIGPGDTDHDVGLSLLLSDVSQHLGRVQHAAPPLHTAQLGLHLLHTHVSGHDQLVELGVVVVGAGGVDDVEVSASLEQTEYQHTECSGHAQVPRSETLSERSKPLTGVQMEEHGHGPGRDVDEGGPHHGLHATEQ